MKFNSFSFNHSITWVYKVLQIFKSSAIQRCRRSTTTATYTTITRIFAHIILKIYKKTYPYINYLKSHKIK